MAHRGLALLAAGLVALGACRGPRAPREEGIAARIRDRVPPAQTAPLRLFYAQRRFEPAWIDPQARQSLLSAIDAARSHGLDPRIYGLDRLRGLATPEERSVDVGAAAERDLAFSSALLDYASDLANGRGQRKPEAQAALLGGVEQMLGRGRIDEGLQGLAPQHPGYQRLREALGRYGTIADSAGWPVVPDPNAPADLVQRRIAAERDGDLRAFQARHGLDETGNLDPPTMQALGVSPADRVRQIALNLERWRRLPRDLGKRYLWVNVTGFSLEAFDGGSRVLAMKIIVGTQYDPTPIFWDQMAYVIFNPYWNIPSSIAAEEILPKGRAFMKREGIEVDSEGKLRQRPGPKNPLGAVKFMFPNQFNVYLHDTPTDQLFERRSRELSHGCIRVEKPLELAEFVLAPSGQWSRQQISAMIESGETKRVDLPEPLPVYILYWTAWVDDAGAVQFRDDLYGYDAALSRQLAAARD